MKCHELYEKIDVSQYRITVEKLLRQFIRYFQEYIHHDHTEEELVQWTADMLTDLFQRHDLFSKHRIVFTLDGNVSEPYVAIGAIDRDGHMRIDLDRRDIENMDIDHWIHALKMIIVHELLHREQVAKSHIDMNTQSSSSNNNKTYLSNKHEIQTSAKDAVDQILRFDGINTSSDVKLYLQNEFEDAKEAIPNIRIYWNMFGSSDDPKDKAVWKRFLKYVLYYAETLI